MESTVKYASEVGIAEMIRRPVPRFGPWGLIRGQSPTGYGPKIPTDWMVRFGDHPRWHRVYCAIYSNCGTCYAIRRGERLILRNSDFPDA